MRLSLFWEGERMTHEEREQALSEEDYIELRHRFGTVVESVVRDMVSGKGERWEQAQADGDNVFKMRDATPEERESIDKYIKSISKPTGIEFDKEQEPKTGHCEDCKHFRKLPYHADILGKCVNHWGFCPKGDWYCADFEPQESEVKG